MFPGIFMNVIGIAGFSGSGKTTLVERLIPLLKAAGKRVSVVKHAHHSFDIDHAGKDTWRHRAAGAFEVVVASDTRMALMREFEREAKLTVHQLIAELYDGVDWVIVEGFKNSDIHKLEVWRASEDKPARYVSDPFVAAIATDSPQHLPQQTQLPVLDLNSPKGVADWILANPTRFEYQAEMFL
jgi:molybdopterin-guanine dinucleotide biosynthesis adapter protein